MIHSENRLAPRMVLIITSHEYRRKLEQTFQNFRIPIYYQCQGHGTAPSEMLDIFGLSGSSRLLTIGLLPLRPKMSSISDGAVPCPWH